MVCLYTVGSSTLAGFTCLSRSVSRPVRALQCCCFFFLRARYGRGRRQRLRDMTVSAVSDLRHADVFGVVGSPSRVGQSPKRFSAAAVVPICPAGMHRRYMETHPPPGKFRGYLYRERQEDKRRATRLWKNVDYIFPKMPFFAVYSPLGLGKIRSELHLGGRVIFRVLRNCTLHEWWYSRLLPARDSV